MTIKRPKRLESGDLIGVVSVSAPEASDEPERLQRGVSFLESQGFRVDVGKVATSRYGYLCGTEQDMATELNEMFADNSVKAVFCAGGGSNANRLLSRIDYDVIGNHPKILLGMSNPTVLLNAISRKCDLVTFHGPAVIWNFGNPEGLSEYTLKHLWPVIREPNGITIEPKPKWESVRRGFAEGRLVGGNLFSLEELLGTPWAPDWQDAILFWEDISKPVNRLDAMLTHFRDAGVFDKIAGMIIGELANCENANGRTINDAVLDLTSEFSFPILGRVDLGHTDDKVTLPIGTRARIDAETNQFRLLEGSVE